MKKIILTLICLTSGLLYNFFAANSIKNDPVITPHRVLEIDLIYANPNNAAINLPEETILSLGISGHQKLVKENKIPESKPLTVIDFSLPSSEKRMWIIDVVSGLVLHYGYVSHGRNSGDLMAKRFSNVSSSYMSSLGFYLTAETYQGKHGYSLRLDGLEPGFNDKARERAIVIHGADYAKEEFIQTTGRLGRSLGCPALPSEEAKEVIDLIKENSLLFIYAKDARYLDESPILNT
ncbi:murein L,D-transpeptidase catalytic domain family protein [Belliella pelovolcani]|uniref:L,D-transpeptidase catalytic domain n=1 Tax=Belliella pelovolcani TaxID=529505 RepID=A0A1N7PVD1_9BACT|nr:murein L,D-transpeptidase catalytic domain family protein [Belliella pelovolcani]SIT14546.1 L,D-transpeptidase catalytic domain [Belliella pelovolcani]